MMEFTWQGIVRNGFGFYNPNHAAAFLNVLIVFAYGLFQRCGAIHRPPLRYSMRTATLLCWICLVLALVSTYSRTGILVFLLGMLFLFADEKKARLVILGLAVVSVAACILSGFYRRFVLDGSTLHRLDIWLAGFRLLRTNFWNGVGFGNAGMVATAWVLPAGIECRTLVNGPLTLLVETGWRFGFLWIPCVCYACLRGRSKKLLWCAFTGLLISSMFSSIPDFGVLFDFTGMRDAMPNFAMSWFLFLIFLALTAVLIYGRFSWKSAVSSAGITGMICLGCRLVTPSTEIPVVRERTVTVGQRINATVCHDGSQTMRRMVRRLSDDVFPAFPVPVTGYRISMDASLDVPPIPNKEMYIVLCGTSAELSEKMESLPVVLVDPPDLPFRMDCVKLIFLPPFRSSPTTETLAAEHGISIIR